jgi:hypothetical protein
MLAPEKPPSSYSLHAQRESAEAYVLSQRQAGWVDIDQLLVALPCEVAGMPGDQRALVFR